MRNVAGHFGNARIAGIELNQARIRSFQWAEHQNAAVNHCLRGLCHRIHAVAPPDKTKRTDATVSAAKVHIR